MLAVFLRDWELRNFRSLEEPFLPATALRRLKTALGFERGERLLQVAYQVSALVREMTEDALRDASTYARQCASERDLSLSLTVNSSYSDHHALGEGQDDRRRLWLPLRGAKRRIEPRSEYSAFP